ncbi:hypothetical protein SO694_00043154 [Aureococcus anophagefferens]|uniref:Uncharacterized protein n=1 Tax=Aureococcus anophagefferens TaxID=44056 RepID=A0ABR1G7K9_AURAN
MHTPGRRTRALRFDGIDLRERIGAALCDDVADVRVVPGTVLAWPQSTSAALVATTRAGAEHALYLKKVASADATDRRSNEVEATFYAEFAAELRGRGAPVCEALVVEDRVAAGGGALFGDVLVDFQWVGVGVGMQDVAFHLIHSVDPSVAPSTRRRSTAAARRGSSPRRVAARYGGAERGGAAEAADHYELSVLDYARHLFSGLPTDAGDAAFAARRDRARWARLR